MDSFNVNAAQQQANSLTRGNQEWNETVRNARAAINASYVNQLKSDKSDKKIDQDVFLAQDAANAISLGLKAPVWNEAQKQWKSSQGVGEFLGKQYASARAGNSALDVVHTTGASVGGALSRAAASGRSYITGNPKPAMQSEAERWFGGNDDIAPTDTNAPTHETAVSTDTGTPATSKPQDITGETAEKYDTPQPESLTEGADAPKTGFDKVAGMIDDAGEALGKVKPLMRIAGNVGGYIDDYDLIKNGFHSNGDALKTTSEWLGGAGALLDTIGVAIPVLEPLGGLLNAAGAITDSIDAHEQDTKQITQTDPQNLANQLKGQKYKNQTPLDNIGLVASQNNHLQNHASGGVGVF